MVRSFEQFVPSNFRRYFEPFAGSACVFFHLGPTTSILADLNSELVATYNALKLDVDLVLECFRRLRTGPDHYYRIRAMSPNTLSGPEAAARFLYLNRYCFNGLYRTNLKGDFNVPYGPPLKPLNAFEDRVRKGVPLLKTATVLTADFASVLEDVESDDFVYLDPPYVLDERRVFSEYLPTSFATRDLARLATSLSLIDARGATFLLSYADSAEARSLAAGWYSRRITTQRNIAGFAGARKQTIELLCSNRPLE